ncbi:MAG TPA: response regulator transcription factor [Propionibacteriaceae bacterium]|nr:response regulator transcription factor [Propionibacteriaceae bacterium]
MSTATTGRPGAAGTVLVVEDEPDLARMVATYMTHAGYRAEVALTGRDALERARRLDPDVVLLDLGLPGLDGVEVCRQLRTFTDCYVLMVTARSDEIDKIVGLSVGADDYITKPFSPRELVARVQAVLRRPRRPAPAEGGSGDSERTFGDLVVDLDGRRVRVDSRPVELTRTEFDILALLAASPTVAFSRRRILDEVWDPGWIGDEHVVDVHVAHLRAKLGDDPGTPRYIDTVRGVGYRMVRP